LAFGAGIAVVALPFLRLSANTHATNTAQTTNRETQTKPNKTKQNKEVAQGLMEDATAAAHWMRL